MNWQLPFFIIFVSLIPSGIISLIIVNKNKELSRPLYFKLMMWGAISVFPAIILVSITTILKGSGFISTFVYSPFIAVALVEETIKLFILIILLYRNGKFRTIRDGIFYSIAIAVGFAFAENIVYLTGSSDQLILILSRSLTAVPLHAICGAYMGYFAGLGKTTEKRFITRALISSTIIHGLYNIFINLNFPYYLLSIILLILSLLILKQLYSKK